MIVGGWFSLALVRESQNASVIFTHISQHARLEIPRDLGDPSAFSPPRPASMSTGRGEQDQKM